MIIKKVEPLSCAKMAGAIYAILWLFVNCLFLLISLTARITGGSSPLSSDGVPRLGLGSPGGLILSILYWVVVSLAALGGAWLYNALARVWGGIEVEVE